MTSPGKTSTVDRPAPADAAAVAYDPAFIRVVSVALMSVLVDGAPDCGDLGVNMARHIAAEPEREASRFAVALATDPAIVAAAQTRDGAGLAAVIAKVRDVWSVMCGHIHDTT